MYHALTRSRSAMPQRPACRITWVCRSRASLFFGAALSLLGSSRALSLLLLRGQCSGGEASSEVHSEIPPQEGESTSILLPLLSSNNQEHFINSLGVFQRRRPSTLQNNTFLPMRYHQLSKKFAVLKGGRAFHMFLWPIQYCSFKKEPCLPDWMCRGMSSMTLRLSPL